MSRWLTIAILFLLALNARAQHEGTVEGDSLAFIKLDSIAKADSVGYLAADSIQMAKPKKDWAKWSPNPQRALWLALVLPGAGQI